MATDPAILAAIAAADRAAEGSATLPSTTDRQLAPADLRTARTPGSAAQIPPQLRGVSRALALVANALVEASQIAVQQDTDPPVTGVNQIRFTGGAIVTDLGDNIVGVEVAGPIDPGQVLSPARVGTTGDLGGVYTVDAGGPFLDQISVAVVPTIDGVGAWSVGDRVLAKDQAVPAENGVYEVIQVGPPWIIQRVSDYNGLQNPGKIIQVLTGTVNGDVVFQQTSPDTDPVTVGGAAGDALVFSQYPLTSGATRLEETVGPTGTYATLDAAITAFAAGDWGDGVNFRIVLLGAASTAWAGLPATTERLIITAAEGGGGTVTFTAPFPGDVILSGDGLRVEVDTTHLCERAVGRVNVLVTDSALVTQLGGGSAYDVGRGSTGAQIIVTDNGRIDGCRLFSANLAGTATVGLIRLMDGILFADATISGTGTGPVLTDFDAFGGSISGSELELSGSAFGTAILSKNLAPTDRAELRGCYSCCGISVERIGAAAINFTWELYADFQNCNFDITNSGAVAGSVTLTGTNASFDGCRMPSNPLGVGNVVTSGTWAIRRLTNVEPVQWEVGDGAATFNIGAADVIQGLDLLTDGPLTLNAPVMRDIELELTNTAGVTHALGTNNSLIDNVQADMDTGTGYQLTVLGRTIRKFRLLNPDSGALGHSFGGVAVTGPEAELIEDLYMQGDRGGLVPVDMTAVNIIGVSARQLAVGDSTYDVFMSAMHMQKNTIAGNLSVLFTEVFMDPAVAQQQGVLDSTQVTGTTATSAGTAVALVHQISNCLFIGSASLDGGAGTNDLHLSNTRFVAAPTIGAGGGGGYARAVVSTSISDVATVVTAVAKAIGTGVIGIS